MAVVGGAFLLAVGFTDAAVLVEHDHRLWFALVHTIDPGAGQISQCREVGLPGQPSGLETAHLAGRGGGAIEAVPIHHGTHCRIVCQTISVVDVLIAGKPAEHGLAKQTSQQVAGVLAAAALRQHRTGEISEAERVIQFSVDQDAGIGGDAAAMEFQLQAAVEIDPQRAIIRFTHWVFHELTTMTAATC